MVFVIVFNFFIVMGYFLPKSSLNIYLRSSEAFLEHVWSLSNIPIYAIVF